MTGIPFSAIFFGGCALGRYVYHSEASEATVLSNLGIGALSGAFTMAIASPADRIKGVLQVQSNNIQYSGPFDAVKKLFKEGGVKCLYQGTSATLLKGVCSGALYMSVYDFLKKKWSTTTAANELDPWAIIGAGGFAGLSVGLICLPLDVLKSRIQTAPRLKYPRGMRDVIKEIVREGNIMRTLYRGWVPIIVRTFPSNAACFFGIELTLLAVDSFQM
uniref:Uncharacterized protein n=1 Tax=Ditylenchus dipsaci TaxID=166011 RepID=A0A915DLK3_9BILA